MTWAYGIWVRTVFCVGVFLFILPVLTGKGRIIRFLLGNPVMVVIGRLSFTIYLVHLIVIIYYFMNTKAGFVITS